MKGAITKQKHSAFGKIGIREERQILSQAVHIIHEHRGAIQKLNDSMVHLQAALKHQRQLNSLNEQRFAYHTNTMEKMFIEVWLGQDHSEAKAAELLQKVRDKQEVEAFQDLCGSIACPTDDDLEDYSNALLDLPDEMD